MSHAATCKCPEGLKELNSPYVACVPEGMNFEKIQCIKDSDCKDGATCRDWKCTAGELLIDDTVVRSDLVLRT